MDKFRQFYQDESVDFMGGEPTLHPRILDVVRHASDIGLRPTVITHGMHLEDMELARAFADAGIHDFLVSVHGIGDTVRAIHGRGSNNYSRQMKALDNLRALGIPFRFNCTLIRDNITQLESIAELAGAKGARVVNFLTFNPYFEWADDPEIAFQARHSEIAPFLKKALDRCTMLGVEANVRYMPICQLRGHESHVYTGFQLPYDTHEWDYNSWYDFGHPGRPSPEWYVEAARTQQERHHYRHAPACSGCSAAAICDGFHSQYLARWGSDEAVPYAGPPVTDPRHFIRNQRKFEYLESSERQTAQPDEQYAPALTVTQFHADGSNRAGVRFRLPVVKR